MELEFGSREQWDNPSLEGRRLFSELLGTFFLVLVAAGGGILVGEGQISPRPMAFAAIAAGSTPATAEIVPSRASSPSATKSPSWSPGSAPSDAISPRAIGRS